MDPITTNMMRAAVVSGGGSPPVAPSFVNATSGQVTNTSGVTITLTGLQANDVVFYTYASDENASMADEESSGFSGWTEVTTGYSATAPANRVRYKVTSSTSESLTFATLNFANRSAAVCMFAFRDVDTSSPVSSVAFAVDAVGTAMTLPSATIPNFSTDTILVGIAGLDDVAASCSPPSGFTEIVDQTTIQASLAVAYKTVAANATESGHIFNFAASDEKVAVAIVLTPA